MIKEEFIYRLKYAMNKKNVTQYSLSKNTGINKGSLSSYMTGKYLPKQDKIIQIASALQINHEWLMCNSDEMDILDPNMYSNTNDETIERNEYYFVDEYISAGIPETVEGNNSLSKIEIPDFLLGRYAGRKDIMLMKVNGESMNKVLPDKSTIFVMTNISLSSLSSEDIVIFDYDGSYGVKKFINDKKNKRIILRPESYDTCFEDLVVEYGDEKLRIHGKVVMYNVML